jgi:hypothetical protein
MDSERLAAGVWTARRARRNGMRPRIDDMRGWIGGADGTATCRRPRAASRPRFGLSLAEVLVAAAILVVAGLAALELLAGADRASLEGRRLALAATEAEHALSDAAVRLARGESPARREAFGAGAAGAGRTLQGHTLQGHTLDGCTLEIRSTRDRVALAAASGAKISYPIERLVAEVRDPSGAALLVLERIAPVPVDGGVP